MIEYKQASEIPVMEHFYTLQGEGFHQGRAAYFIRLAGCDVGCHWCDVKDSWEADASQVIHISKILEEMDTYPAGICVITGGEPSMYDLSALTDMLHQAGWHTHIETSGTYSLTGDLDWICVSPKKFMAARNEWLTAADELKVIVYNKSDFIFAEEYISKVGKECRLYLQPEWSKEKLVLPLIIEYIKEHPDWQISLQLHKYLGVD